TTRRTSPPVWSSVRRGAEIGVVKKRRAQRASRGHGRGDRVSPWVLLLLGVGLPGCRGEGTTPAVHTAAVAAPEAETPSAADPPDPGLEPASGRVLWFPHGPGREAILAR